MKRYLLKIISAALAGVMLMGTAVSAETVDYTNSNQDKKVVVNIVDESGKKIGDGNIDTNALVVGRMATINADPEVYGKYFSHYEYVTTARNYDACYDESFTFFVDPPMTINVVYGTQKADHSGDSVKAGMYKNPEFKDGNTYFYCSVVAAKDKIDASETTADIIFGRSEMKRANENDGNNSEKFTTSAEQNIYDESSKNTFQYIVSSGIQAGSPINFDAQLTNDEGAKAQIKTWDLEKGIFVNAKDDETINGLTVETDKLTFTANVGDKIRVYTESGEPSGIGGMKLLGQNEEGNIYEYRADTSSTIYMNREGVNKIMVNPMDVAVKTEGSTEPETSAPSAPQLGTIKVTLKNSSTVEGVKDTPVKGAKVTAKKDDSDIEFTVPEKDNGEYYVSVPAGDYTVTAKINDETATGNAQNVTANAETLVEIEIKDIEAEREYKINTYINEILLKEVDPNSTGGKNSKDPWDGSVWNSESREFKWSYINGCMMTAFMDMYDVTKEEVYKNNADTYMYKFLDTGTNKVKSAGDISKRHELDDINPGKSLLDLIDNESDHANEFKTTVGQLNDIIKATSRIKDKNGTELNFWHKDSYPYQIWLDGTYMVLPYMIQNEYIINNSQNLKSVAQDVTRQFQTVHDKMRDEETGLYYHGYDAQADSAMGSDIYNTDNAMSWAKGSTARSKGENSDNCYLIQDTNDGSPTPNYYSQFDSQASKVGCSDSFWSRAMGWYAMALIDTYEQMTIAEERSKQSLSEEKDSIKKIFTELMDSILEYQYEIGSDGNPTGKSGVCTGLWYQVVDNPQDENNKSQNYIETSGSAAYAVSLMKGFNLGVLTDEKYYNAGLNAFNAITDYKFNIKKNTDGKYEPSENGIFDICGQAGLGGVSGNSRKNQASKSTWESAGGRSPYYNFRDGSFDYYISEKTAKNDAKGAAPYLMAYAQKIKHDKVAAGN